MTAIPRRADEVPVRVFSLPFLGHEGSNRDRILTAALVASILVHAVVLTLKFRAFEITRSDDLNPSLQVALVNAKSPTRPVKADVLAQAHLDGGGNTDAERRVKTPLPVLPKQEVSQDVAVASKAVEVLETQAQDLMNRLRGAPMVAMNAPAPSEATEKTELPTSTEMMQRTLELMRLEAQIDKDMDTYQKRPKRRFIGARAEEYRFARYVEDWRLKVERIGNLNYPEAARAQKLYGSLQLSVSIRADGSIEKIEVERSSGQKILDAAAVRVVELAAPYSSFPPNIRRDTDILTITRTWSFVNGDALVTQ